MEWLDSWEIHPKWGGKNPSMEVRETESSLLGRKERETKGCWQEQSSEDHRLCAGEPSAQGVQRETVKAVYDNHRTEMKARISTNRAQPQCVWSLKSMSFVLLHHVSTW